MFSTNNLDILQKTIKYNFKDINILVRALTRTSALNENVNLAKQGDFQRLEFIGDKVLNLVISQILFDNYPKWNEGQLTQEENKLVNNKGPLSTIAESIKLGGYLIMGKGEKNQNQARKNKKVLSDAFEALIGAIWIDSDNDFKLIKNFIRIQFKTLNLFDFNEEYKEQTIKFAARKMNSDILEQILPEMYEGEGWGNNITTGELLRYYKIQKQATKPLDEFTQSMKNYLETASDEEGSYEESSSQDTSEEQNSEDEDSKEIVIPVTKYKPSTQKK